MTQSIPYDEGQITAPGVHNAPPRNYQLDALTEDQIKAARQKFNKALLQIIVKAITGQFIFNPNDPDNEQNQLTAWAENIPILGDLIEVITGIEDGNLNDLGTWVNNIKKALGDFDLSDPDFSFELWARNFSAVVLAPLTRLLNPLFGLEERPNLWADGDFPTSASVPINVSGLSWDNTAGRTTLGTLKMTLTGPTVEYLSNPIAVTAGQKFLASAWAKWSGLAGTGIVIKLSVNTYDSADILVTTTTLAQFSSPAANQTAYLELTNSPTLWAVPVGIATVRFRLSVENVTAGAVTFDDASAIKTTLLKQLLQKIIDSIVGPLHGTSTEGYTVDDLLDATASQADTITGTSAQMMQLLAAFDDGNPDADDFERFSLSSPGPGWTYFSSSGGGTLATPNKHDLSWSSLVDSEVVAYRNAVPAEGNNQTATIILNGAPEKIDTLVAYNHIWLRMTAFTAWSNRTGLRFSFGADKTIEVWWFNNGVGTLLFSELLPVAPTIGSVLECSAGVALTPLQMTARFNGKLVLDETDPGTSTYGPTQVYRGLGLQKDAGLLRSADPGRVKQFTARG